MRNPPPTVRTTRSVSVAAPSVMRTIPTRSVILPATEDDVAEHYVVIPPDGGWGWVVVAVAFVCNFIIDGTTYTFGIFLTDISKTFEVHPTKVALVSSLLSGFYYFAGPLTCALANKFGFRCVGIMGGLFSAATFLVSSFLEDFLAFLLVIGVCAGIAFNMVYTPCMLVVGFYFEKWRALATAISVTGTAIGIMAFPLVMEQLLGNLHWRTKFQILSATCGLLAVLVIAFRPLKATKIIGGDKKVTFNDSDSIGSFHVEDEEEVSEENTFSIKRIFQDFHNRFFPTVEEVAIGSHDPSRRQTGETFLAILPDDGVSEFSFTRSCFRVSASVAPSTVMAQAEVEPEVEKKKSKCCSCPRLCQDKNFNRPLYRDDIFYAGSVYTLRQFDKRDGSKITITSNNPSRKLSYHMSVSRVITQKDIEESRECQCCPEAFVRVLVTMLDYRLFKQLAFVMLTASGFLTMIGLYIPFVFIVERGYELGFGPTQATLLLSAMGGANVVGRVACGIVSIFPKMDALVVSWVTLVLGGLITVASGFIQNFSGQLFFVSIFGICVASFTTLRTVVLANMLGLDNLTNAFGITILFYGLASFVGIPLSGYIQNVSGSYGNCFVFAGSALFLSGILLIPINKVSEWESKKKKPRVVQFRV
ncbi:unnamed protein product [Phaedon cochleariae]|uniref:Monocarboxylate transporter n=1 Tax=Phaedon cochleariae TaxID=80249 RepID=A0A9P0GSM7_PHACE|nr:unnamed protein product [Phaedon cochleariae]